MIHIKVHTTGFQGKLGKREMNRLSAETWLDVGRRIHRWHVPKHFTKEGAREYRFAPRKGEAGNPHPKGFLASYTGRKLRKFGHTLPLVWTGLSRTLSLRMNLRYTAKGVAVILSSGFNRRNPRSKIDMRAEMTAVSATDAKEVERTFRDLLEERFKKLNVSETRIVS